MTLARLQEHACIWADKPSLRRAYEVWFRLLTDPLPPNARVLEVGAGPGMLSRHARSVRPDLRWVASDLVVAPWNDLSADAATLPFVSGAFEAVVGLDVIHHLARPRAFLSEAARVLRSRGHLALVEPWVTPLSYPVYRWLHQEGCDMSRDPWSPFGPEADNPKDAFDGNAAVLRLLVREGARAGWRGLGLEAPRVTPLNAFAYLLSLGFRRASLLPPSLVGPLLRIDAALGAMAPLLAMRALAVWQRARGTDEDQA